MSERPVFGRDVDPLASREFEQRRVRDQGATVRRALLAVPAAPPARVLEIAIPGIPPRPNATRRRDWHKNAEEGAEWRRTAYLSGLDVARRSGFVDELPFLRADVEYEFLLERAAGDLDNLVAASKPILDGIRDAGIIVDDSIRVVSRLTSTWRKAARAGVLVRVRRIE